MSSGGGRSEGQVSQPAMPAVAGGGGGGGVRADPPWEYSLRKYLLLLATLVATVACAAGFNPPGGVWQETVTGAGGHLAGDPIIRDTRHSRYVAFFYLNATALACSLVVTVLILILSILHDKDRPGATAHPAAPLLVLRVVMVLDLLSLMGAYAAGTCRDKLTALYSSVLAAGVVVFVVVHKVQAYRSSEPVTPRGGPTALVRLRKVLMLLATFAVSVTYLAGLSAPGGFWDHAESDYLPGDAVLKGGPHGRRLKVFFVFNTTAFAASLAIIALLLDKRLRRSDSLRERDLYGFIFVMLAGLVGAYSAGSCRQTDTTVYLYALIGAVVACILLQWVIAEYCHDAINCVSNWLRRIKSWCFGRQSSNGDGSDEQQQGLEKARSLVLLLATLAATITYQAGLNPPGGVWQDTVTGAGGHLAGDPVLLTRNRRRYRAFYYCNSVAFVASLAAVVLVQRKGLLKHQALEVAMILDLFGLIGAYAAGSSRDVSTSIYTVALAGAVLVYVVIHVVFFTLDHNGGHATGHHGGDGQSPEEKQLERRRKRLLLFGILLATITYQAGLTPPSGFRLQDDEPAVPGHRAGDPVLLYNYPRRYWAFFYCNSASFMLSIALIILLVNPNLYRPAIRSSALSVCTAAGMSGLLGAYAAGSTQHLKTSFYIFALAALVLSFVVVLLIIFCRRHNVTGPERGAGHVGDGTAQENAAESSSAPASVTGTAGAGDANNAANGTPAPAPALAPAPAPAPATEGTGGGDEKKLHAKRKYLMVLGILVASVTYQAGMQPPGGVWQTYDGGRRDAGSPVMHDNRRPRYLAFFYGNSVSFVASVVVIILLLPETLPEPANKWWLGVMNVTIVLDLLALLLAYAAGSSRSWKSSAIVSAILLGVLAYFPIHVALSRWCRKVFGADETNTRRPVESTTHVSPSAVAV